MTDHSHDDNNPASWSLEAWEEADLIEFSISDKRSVRLRIGDGLGMIASDTTNPLAGLMMSASEGKTEAEAVPAFGFIKGINQLLLQVIVDPFLKEQGNSHPKAPSINSIPLAKKMEMFTLITGGQFDIASRFLPEQGENVDGGQDGGTVRQDPKPDTTDQSPNLTVLGG